jgi:membrane protein implicated in regulation of membrane protease activity
VTVGLTLIVVGVAVFITPLPLGSPTIALGLFLLLRTSARARLLRRRLARRYPDAARRFEAGRRRLLQRIQQARTRIAGGPSRDT